MPTKMFAFISIKLTPYLKLALFPEEPMPSLARMSWHFEAVNMEQNITKVQDDE